MEAEREKLRQLEDDLLNRYMQVNDLKKQIDRQKRYIFTICVKSGGHRWIKKEGFGGMRDNNDFDYVCEVCGFE